jgi:hypothetical protein
MIGNKAKRSIAMLLSLVVVMGVMTVSAAASTVEPNSLAEMSSGFDPDGREYKYLKGIANKGLWNYSRLDVFIGQKVLSVKGFIYGDTIYVPFRQAASAISGSNYYYDSSTKTSTMKAPGLEIVAGDGCYVTYANGRAFFNTVPNVRGCTLNSVPGVR